MIRPGTQARDDQVLAAVRTCDNMATTMEVCAALAGQGVDPNAIYPQVYGSLVRLFRAELVERRRFQYNANTYWRAVYAPADLSALDWSTSKGDQ